LMADALFVHSTFLDEKEGAARVESQ